jgi:regulation of enolase protein 1 (concanavalin A-like superfamily)
LAANAKQAYLRLERQGEDLRASISPDGKTWTTLLNFGTPVAGKVKVGLAAFSHSKDRSSVRFDQLQLIPLPRRVKLPGGADIYIE